MYTFEQDQDGHYDILDPNGDIICTVLYLGQAKSLLSHLNR